MHSAMGLGFSAEITELSRDGMLPPPHHPSHPHGATEARRSASTEKCPLVSRSFEHVQPLIRQKSMHCARECVHARAHVGLSPSLFVSASVCECECVSLALSVSFRISLCASFSPSLSSSLSHSLSLPPFPPSPRSLTRSRRQRRGSLYADLKGPGPSQQSSAELLQAQAPPPQLYFSASLKSMPALPYPLFQAVHVCDCSKFQQCFVTRHAFEFMSCRPTRSKFSKPHENQLAEASAEASAADE